MTRDEIIELIKLNNITRPHCPICEEGSLLCEYIVVKFEHNGNDLIAEAAEQWCDTCGTTMMPPEWVVYNHQMKKVAINEYYCLLDYKESV